MLYFLQRPDETFHHIVREALVWLKEELTEGETNPEIQMNLQTSLLSFALLASFVIRHSAINP